MNIRRLLIVCAAALVVALPSLAGNQDIRTYYLFNGVSAADSSEQASIWIPIRGASRVYVRTFSAGAAADTDFCDTLTTWKTLFSDSVLFMARDSVGTIVTARSTQSSVGAFPMCADSVVITNQLADSVKMIAVINPVQGVAKPLRGSVTGSGYYTIIMPTVIQAGIPNTPLNAQVAGTNDVFMAQYMRIRYTPRTRLTTAGFSSTAGTRTRGINKLRMIASVVYDNK